MRADSKTDTPPGLRAPTSAVHSQQRAALQALLSPNRCYQVFSRRTISPAIATGVIEDEIYFDTGKARARAELLWHEVSKSVLPFLGLRAHW